MLKKTFFSILAKLNTYPADELQRKKDEYLEKVRSVKLRKLATADVNQYGDDLGKIYKDLKKKETEKIQSLKNINKELKSKALEEIVIYVIYPEEYPEELLPKEKFEMQIEQEARPAVTDIDYDKIRQLRIELEQKKPINNVVI